MEIKVIQDRLEQYQCTNTLEEENAIKEMVQEIALLALSRLGFFSVAEFHGGTALRILYSLQRFSEDLDFALLKPDKTFDFSRYLNGIAQEFMQFGFSVDVQDRSKADNVIKKAFLKDRSIGKVLALKFPIHERNEKVLKIKLEIDVNPPEGTTTEMKYLDFPLPYSVVAKDIASSYSGKLHALLCRSYLKGRDWYDFLWYVRRNTSPNLTLLQNAIEQNGPWQNTNEEINLIWVRDQLKHKITNINWNEAKLDVEKFLKPIELEGLRVWSQDFFIDQVEKSFCNHIRDES